MDCDKCASPAVVHADYPGLHLCEDHFCASVEKRVRRRVREDNLLGRGATPETWVIGLSGGKDSVVLTHTLQETFTADPRVELVALSVHEGIGGYRDESLDACRDLTADLGLRHEIVTYEDEFEIRMDDVVSDDPEDMSACGYCGVFRRDILSRYAAEFGADRFLTGNNLDDEVETALMDFLEGDIRKIAQQFDASLGPFEGETEKRTRGESDEFVPRAKPLRDVPEKEVALYARFRDLPAHITECPHASEAFRGEIKELLYELEELAALAASEYRGDGTELDECSQCGSPTTGDQCRKCGLLDALEAV